MIFKAKENPILIPAPEGRNFTNYDDVNIILFGDGKNDKHQGLLTTMYSTWKNANTNLRYLLKFYIITAEGEEQTLENLIN